MITALYVDDEPGLLEVTQLFLEKDSGFKVDTAISAQDALALPSLAAYDVIISDYQMPEMDGIAFLKAVRERFGDLPFILFTGRGREEVVIEAINNGADFYLQKGGDPKAQFAELAHKVRQAVARRSAELSCIESEKRLTDIIDFLPDAMVAIDRAGRVIAWNRAMEEMTGASAAEMLGMGEGEYAIRLYGTRRKMLIDLVFEPDESATQEYAHIHREKGVLTAESIHAILKGEPVILAGKAGPLYNRQGEVVGAIESIRDITEMKKAGESLRESEGRFAAFMEHLPVTAFIKDEHSTNLFVNRHMIEIFGEAEWIGKTVYEQFPGGAAEKMVEDDQQTLREGYRKTIEYLTDKNGEKKIFETYKFRIDRGTKSPLIGGFAIDITEKKEEEKALHENEQRLTSIYNTVENVIFQLNVEPGEQYRFSSVSSAFSTVTGLPPGQVIGRTVDEIIPEPSLSMVREKYREAIRKKAVIRWEETSRYPTGELIGEVSIAPIFDTEGNCTHLIGSVHDITRRKRTEDELRKKNEELRALNEEIAASEEELRTKIGELTQKEQALKESERRNAAMIAAMPDLLFILSRDGTYLDFQASDENLLAIPPNRIIGKNILDAGFDAGTATMVLRATAAAIDTGRLQKIEYSLAVPSGITRFEARLVRLGDDRVLGIVRDITELSRAARENKTA